MASIHDLSKEVRRLQRRVRELEGSPEANQRAVEAIVGDGEAVDKPSGGGGFAAACAESRQNLIRKNLDQAIDELSQNPHCCDTAAAEAAFRRDYSVVPAVDLDRIIRVAREG